MDQHMNSQWMEDTYSIVVMCRVSKFTLGRTVFPIDSKGFDLCRNNPADLHEELDVRIFRSNGTCCNTLEEIVVPPDFADSVGFTQL